jgi:hypothetical protein
MVQPITDFFDSIFSIGLMKTITIIEIVGLVALIVIEIIKSIKLKNFSSVDDKPTEIKAS